MFLTAFYGLRVTYDKTVARLNVTGFGWLRSSYECITILGNRLRFRLPKIVPKNQT